MSRRGLATTLRVLGAGATAIAVSDLVRGAGRLTSAPVPADVDSELRFGSAWYAVGGVLMFRSARRPEAERATIELVSAGWLLAALGRVLSIRTHGRPSPLYVGLLAAEVAIPTVLVPWQRRVEAAAR